MDTIFAVSSGAPPAAIAVLRISGPAAVPVAQKLAGTLPRPRKAGLRALRTLDGALLDRALVLVFPGPRSATGEDVVELHVHGGRAVVHAVEQQLIAEPGLRPADPGEFTRRALMNGIIDLTEAEGLGDLLAAQTEGQRVAALRIADGGLRHKIERWSSELLDIAASVEAQLDFADEDDVPDEDGLQMILALTAEVRDEMGVLLSSPAVERLRDGVRVVIAGPPNSGKSTLLNTLTERSAAIVSPVAGTTRDLIEAPVTRSGIAYLLTDTAGLVVDSGDLVEAMGVELAMDAIEQADIVVWLGDEGPPAHAIWVHARADLIGRSELPLGRYLAISAKTGAGIDQLWEAMALRARNILPSEGVLAMNHRQRELIAICRDELPSNEVKNPLIVAEGLRLGLRALDRITGKSDVDQVLDALFKSFCIGK